MDASQARLQKPPEALPPCALRADPTRLPKTLDVPTQPAKMEAPLKIKGPPMPFGRGGRALLPS